MSQLLSLAIVAVCLVALVVLVIKYKKNPQPIDGIDFFLEEQLKAEKEACEKEEDNEITVAVSEGDDKFEE